MSGNMTKDESRELVTITLPSEYWVTVLSAIDQYVRKSQSITDEMRRNGVDASHLPKDVITALASPVFIRGEIVDRLSEKGIMTDEASSIMGRKAILEKLERAK